MLKAFQYFRPHPLRLVPIVLASVVEMIFNAQIPLRVKYMIARALLGHNERMMIYILGALAASIVVVSITSVTRDDLYARIVGQVIANFRERMFEHLQRLSMDFYARTDAGGVMLMYPPPEFSGEHGSDLSVRSRQTPGTRAPRGMLQAGGIYAKMWQKQSGLRISPDDEGAKVEAAWLREIPLMKGVSLKTLEEVARLFGTERFAANRVIVHEGDAGDRFDILARGQVEVLRGENEHAARIGTLEDGDYFGEMALLSNHPRNATVRTLTPCVCLSLPHDLFDRLLASEPELREEIRKVAIARAAV